MAGPQGRLLLCFLAFRLAGSSFVRGQVSMRWLPGGRAGMYTHRAQVWGHTHTAAVTCLAFSRQDQSVGFHAHLPRLRLSQVAGVCWPAILCAQHAMWCGQPAQGSWLEGEGVEPDPSACPWPRLRPRLSVTLVWELDMGSPPALQG